MGLNRIGSEGWPPLVAIDPTESLRLSRDEARVWRLIANGAREGMGAGEAGYRLGLAAGLDAILVQAALTEQNLPTGAFSSVAVGASSEFPVRAVDLAPLEGRALGERLKQLEEQWIDSDFSKTKELLLA